MSHPRDSQAGFTLVEALIAIVVLAFGLIAVSNLLVVATGSNGIANNATTSTALAMERLEQLKAVPFIQLAQGGSLTADVTDASGQPAWRNDTIAGVGTFHTRWQIKALDVDTYAITVQSEGQMPLARSIARSQFTTVRSCSSSAMGCP